MASKKNSALYTIGFAGAICIVCSILVSTSAVTLKEMQEENKKLDKRLNVLKAAQLVDTGDKLTSEDINKLIDERVKIKAITLKNGKPTDTIDPETFDARLAAANPDLSHAVPDNGAKVTRVTNASVIYEVMDGERMDLVVLPVRGKGLWSTLYGFLAIDGDGTTIRGISFYEHGETPGLGGEIENPKWQTRWLGRKLFDAQGNVAFQVIKGKAGTPDTDPYKVDGLSGATLTSSGVSNLVRFWMGQNGFGPYLKSLNTPRSM